MNFEDFNIIFKRNIMDSFTESKAIRIKWAKFFIEFHHLPEIKFDPISDMKIVIKGIRYVPSPIYRIHGKKGWHSECPDLTTCQIIRYEFEEFSQKEAKAGANQLISNIKHRFPQHKIEIWHTKEVLT